MRSETDGTVTTIPVAPPEEVTDADWNQAADSCRRFLRPQSVAVVGASRSRGTIGGEIFHNLLSYGFTGVVYPVNARASSVQGVRAYATIDDIPGSVDLAVIAVPSEQVLELIAPCARKGVGSLVVISAGFADAGVEGKARQQELVRLCRAAGIRVIGPNCMGIVNTHPDVRLNATFAPAPPCRGRLAFLSQSGALGLAVMDYSSRLGLGLESFVSIGNRADVSPNDLIRYWAEDPDVDVILLYLESFGNPRKFARIARTVARSKPIVAVKSGRSPVGARAAGSHTGALLAASDTAVDALLESAGVIRTDTLEELFDVASLLAHQPVPAGPRVAIITNAGGPGILCADACSAAGLDVPALAPETKAALRALLPPEASVENPIDLIASAPAGSFREAIRLVGADPSVDALIVIYVPPLVTGAEAVARAIVEGAGSLARKPIATVFMQARGVPEDLSASGARIPSYAFPENAAIALARTMRYGAWLARPEEQPGQPQGIDREGAARVVARASEAVRRSSSRDADSFWLAPKDVEDLLVAYGVPLVEQLSGLALAEVGAAAAALGGNLALKASSPRLVHKTEAGAVALNVASSQAEERARVIASRLAAQGHEDATFTLQRMEPEGLEMIVGAVHDPQFGPVLACGAGGALVELLGDVAVRIAPVSRREALAMLRTLKTHPLIAGYRGSPPLDEEALVDVILRIGQLAHEHPEIQEMDLNPVRVRKEGVVVLDARVRVAR